MTNEVVINHGKGTVQIPLKSHKHIYYLLMGQLVAIRKSHGLTLDKMPREVGLLKPHDHQQKGIIEIAESLGLDLGGKWGREVDLREFEE